MQFPRRTLRSIPTLPSIYTSFPSHAELDSRTASTNETTASTATTDDIESGLELVPIERSNTTCGKILSPITDEKEVVIEANILYPRAKPLPNLPRHRWRQSPKHSWNQLRLRYRVLAVICAQVCLALTIMGGMMSVKGGNSETQTSNLESNPESPSDTPSIPIKRGQFNIALGDARQQSSTCLSRANESAAWACSNDEVLEITIEADEENQQPDKTTVAIKSTNQHQKAKYGQSPLEVLPSLLTPSEDPEAPQKGLAYHFKTSYNRTVLLANQDPPIKNMPSGRMAIENSELKEGDKPWLCFFNETIVEGFIYVSLRSSLTNITVTNSTVAPGGIERGGSANPQSVPSLPYTLKLSEQRRPNGPLPYCERRTVSKDGSISSTSTENLLLMPSDAAFTLSSTSARRYMPRSELSTDKKRQTLSTDRLCRCQWMIQ